MTYEVICLIIYIIIGLAFGISLNKLIESQMFTGDADFDENMSNKKLRYIALIIISCMWAVTLPTYIALNIFNNEEV